MVALVTGANRGIGLETARQLAQRGIEVVLGSRDESKGREAQVLLELEGLIVDYVHLDMEVADHFENVRRHIEQKYAQLDILINNAGVQIESDVWGVNTTTSISMSALRRTFEINFFGMVDLTRRLLPLLLKSPAARIVNVTSILASMSMQATPGSPTYNTKTFAYNASKAAVNSFTVHLAHELRHTSVKVNAAHPGWVKTEMGGPEARLELHEGAATCVRLALLDATGPNGQYMYMDKHLPW